MKSDSKIKAKTVRMTCPDLMMDERRQLYLLYARYMGVSMGVSISRIEEEHDRVVAMWNSKDATRDKAERAGDAR